ncbi:hypothetical protein ACFSQ7_50090 [Paenibacillus rhizoplanae]
MTELVLTTHPLIRTEAIAVISPIFHIEFLFTVFFHPFKFPYLIFKIIIHRLNDGKMTKFDNAGAIPGRTGECCTNEEIQELL